MMVEAKMKRIVLVLLPTFIGVGSALVDDPF